MSIGDFEPAALSVLVLDDNPFQRAIAVDQLRAIGFRRVLALGGIEEAWEALQSQKPDILVLEWLAALGDDLDFIRRVRSEGDFGKSISIFMLTRRGTRGDVEDAREAGVDGFLRKPISALSLQRRVRSVVISPQPFVESGAYLGPCRRRRQDPEFDGPFRRSADAERLAAIDATDGGAVYDALSAGKLVALDAAIARYSTFKAGGYRAMVDALEDILASAQQHRDTHLTMGARELLRYLRLRDSATRASTEVLRTHAAALHQLWALPHAFDDERRRMARGLKRMIDKKLRRDVLTL